MSKIPKTKMIQIMTINFRNNCREDKKEENLHQKIAVNLQRVEMSSVFKRTYMKLGGKNNQRQM